MTMTSPASSGASTIVPGQTVLFSMTDSAQSAYYVEAGAVLCTERSVSGRARLRLATTGDVVGEAALVGERTFGATARTLCETSVRVWVRPTRREDLADGETAALLRLAMRQVRSEVEALERRAREPAVARTARVVLRLAAEIGARQPAGARLRHGLSQTELARLAGVDRATVNRALASMVRRGWIETGSGWVALRDAAAVGALLDRS